MFRFQRFTVHDDQCGHAVGTDGILLGAWAACDQATRILDVGTGSGLIALMLAQRTEGRSDPPHIDAIETSTSAARQAAANVAASPWADRIAVRGHSLEAHRQLCQAAAQTYDLVICNPPFFNMTQPANQERALARHQCGLSLSELCVASRGLLSARGHLDVILPVNQYKVIQAEARPLMVKRQTLVHPKPNHAAKRVLLSLSGEDVELETDQLVLEVDKHQYTSAFKQLTAGFHLAHA